MEFLIYAGLLGILLVVIGQIFTASIEVQTSGENVSYVNMDGQHIMSRIQYDIGRASDIVTPNAPGAAGSTLQLTIGGATRTYSLTGTSMLLDGVALNGFGTRVSALNFVRAGSGGGKDTISIALTLESIASSAAGAHSQTFTSTYGLR